MSGKVLLKPICRILEVRGLRIWIVDTSIVHELVEATDVLSCSHLIKKVFSLVALVNHVLGSCLE